MEIPERRRPVGQSCLQDPKVTQRSFDLRRPLRKRFAKSRPSARYVGAALIRKKSHSMERYRTQKKLGREMAEGFGGP